MIQKNQMQKRTQMRFFYGDKRVPVSALCQDSSILLGQMKSLN